ncbi:hypothetical protein BV25DRAFT_1843608 [Artomyces pyxidatus]|uniref:Uncharacterized protein n=1 Tax=Artomyces pyxidatus TaxID=48021 RepID=A0ACB8SFG9_9AGAM|nr:hypothetical protein BV25DRAFT_1843608 [Artomyces pyxidatus]
MQFPIALRYLSPAVMVMALLSFILLARISSGAPEACPLDKDLSEIPAAFTLSSPYVSNPSAIRAMASLSKTRKNKAGLTGLNLGVGNVLNVFKCHATRFVRYLGCIVRLTEWSRHAQTYFNFAESLLKKAVSDTTNMILGRDWNITMLCEWYPEGIMNWIKSAMQDTFGYLKPRHSLLSMWYAMLPEAWSSVFPGDGYIERIEISPAASSLASPATMDYVANLRLYRMQLSLFLEQSQKFITLVTDQISRVRSATETLPRSTGEGTLGYLCAAGLRYACGKLAEQKEKYASTFAEALQYEARELCVSIEAFSVMDYQHFGQYIASLPAAGREESREVSLAKRTFIKEAQMAMQWKVTGLEESCEAVTLEDGAFYRVALEYHLIALECLAETVLMHIDDSFPDAIAAVLFRQSAIKIQDRLNVISQLISRRILQPQRFEEDAEISVLTCPFSHSLRVHYRARRETKRHMLCESRSQDDARIVCGKVMRGPRHGCRDLRERGGPKAEGERSSEEEWGDVGDRLHQRPRRTDHHCFSQLSVIEMDMPETRRQSGT